MGKNQVMEPYHVPVLLKETLEYLAVRPGKTYIDCTLGGGGHTEAILRAGGRVIGIDQDSEAIAHVTERLGEKGANLTLKHSNFAHLQEIALEMGIGKVAGILLDLGVSSHQLGTAERGFSFHLPGKLDMRMDKETQGVTAADLVAAGSEEELAHIFWNYGDESMGRKIARAIVATRAVEPITTTEQLAELVARVKPRKRDSHIHPATQVFQALRIAVNSELASLESVIPSAVTLLEKDGRLVIISFHSLEDRMVKTKLGEYSDLEVLTKKPVVATDEEIERNPKSRSAKLRAAVKII